eukprot:4155-Heterococcus_DN1.PRE.1
MHRACRYIACDSCCMCIAHLCLPAVLSHLWRSVLLNTAADCGRGQSSSSHTSKAICHVSIVRALASSDEACAADKHSALNINNLKLTTIGTSLKDFCLQLELMKTVVFCVAKLPCKQIRCMHCCDKRTRAHALYLATSSSTLRLAIRCCAPLMQASSRVKNL